MLDTVLEEILIDFRLVILAISKAGYKLGSFTKNGQYM